MQYNKREGKGEKSMNQSNIDAIYNLLDSIKVTKDNKKLIEETRKNMANGEYAEAGS